MDLVTLNDLMFVIADGEISLKYEVMVTVESLSVSFTVPTSPIGYHEEIGVTLHSHCGTFQIAISNDGQDDEWYVQTIASMRNGKFKPEVVKSYHDGVEELKLYIEESQNIFAPGDIFYIKMSCDGDTTSIQIAKGMSTSLSGFPQILGVKMGYTGGSGHTPNVSKDYLVEIFHADWLSS
ncbi:MAG: hypothetical protein 2 [Alphanucleorhabdovirus xinjianensis]|uniref:Uncharacterized protein n=1 Tax=Xinjiang nucleorhabdovirus TaxID=2824629 RepID=A0AAE9IIC4_9RHAB|nr:MAG: hypothetical protein 2 [Xinjiang nucleorhabdovirus]